MNILFKNLLITAVISTAGFYILDSMLNDLSPEFSASSESASTEKTSQSDELEDQLEQLIAGADPSDIFEPTAAGGYQDCLHGRIQMPEDNRTLLHDRLYLAHRSNGMTYIQTLEPSDTYLVQGPLQAVTATQHSAIPAHAKLALQRDFNQLEKCKERSFYLYSINEASP
ncbi:hypothetical protein [Marinobacterium mangrovicola]|uniref:Uncharacterized protein n=1 Tax=Marinobacterium mangrovicola TaxID=1476959 RepID=A0A4R1GEJ7_9GAMM|nr:hypothetical protein [Marinobacterium mangrovicola]TCK02672.1 hypothetical protein CLV83_4369 [Marinobacterium mangrovicola]